MQINLSSEDAAILWNDLVEMAGDLPDDSLLPWLERLTPVSLRDGNMVVSTRQNWTGKKVMGEYRPVIEALLKEITLEDITLDVIVSAGTSVAQGTSPVQEYSQAMTGVSGTSVGMAGIAGITGIVGDGGVSGGVPSHVAAAAQLGAQMGAQMARSAHTPAPMPVSTGAGGKASQQVYDTDMRFDVQGQQGQYTPGLTPAQAAGREIFVKDASGGSLAVESSTGATTTATAAPYGTSANTYTGASRKMAVGTGSVSPYPDAHTYAVQNGRDDGPSSGMPQISTQRKTRGDGIPILEEGSVSAVSTVAQNTNFQDFSFDTYIVGETNELAFNMAHAVAEQPGSVANPLFIWGPSGNGKTHLLLSILNYINKYQPSLRALYVPSNTFVERYIDDIRNKKLKGTEVLKEYRDIDVLLVDDVQFFEDKQESVSTFFDIFNKFTLAGKQIVLAADIPPDYLRLDDRMRTRFGQGLVVDIKAPTYEMKRSILKNFYERNKKNMKWCKVDISEDMFDTIAQLAPNNPRNMQGLIASIMLKANDNNHVLSVEGIKRIINDLYKSTNVVNIASIIRVVCSSYNVSPDEVKGKKRNKNISEARQVVMWMARQLTEESYESIGTQLGGRDHSTVYYGITTIDKRATEDKSYSYKLERLKKEIVGAK